MVCESYERGDILVIFCVYVVNNVEVFEQLFLLNIEIIKRSLEQLLIVGKVGVFVDIESVNYWVCIREWMGKLWWFYCLFYFQKFSS